MAGLPWYSGEMGVSSLVGRLDDIRKDYRTLRRGFHWDTPRPKAWPERSAATPDRPTDLGWARMEPIRSIRYGLQKGILDPFTKAMTDPVVEGGEWVEDLERPAIIVANHVSHSDTPLLLYALGDRTREKTVVAAAEDYFYSNPWMGRLVGLWLNTFPLSRTGGAADVLHSSSQLLKSGWNLLIYPEGTRSPDGRMGEFKAGVGFLATENRVPVIPMHVRGSHRVMPKGRDIPLPAPVTIRIGKPITPADGEHSKPFTARVQKAVEALASGREDSSVNGTWIERWQATGPRRS